MTRQRGFTYVELLAVTVLLGLVLTPALQLLQSAVQVEQVNREAMQNDLHLLGLMDEVLAEPFEVLQDAALGTSSPSRYSDPEGTPWRRLVFVYAVDVDDADGDGNVQTGVDDGILGILVQRESGAPSLATLRFDQG